MMRLPARAWRPGWPGSTRPKIRRIAAPHQPLQDPGVHVDAWARARQAAGAVLRTAGSPRRASWYQCLAAEGAPAASPARRARRVSGQNDGPPGQAGAVVHLSCGRWHP